MNQSVREQIAEDIQGWDAITDHRTGTDGDRQTSVWLADLVTAAGAEPTIDSFDFDRRIPRDCAILIDDQRIEGVPLFDCPGTGPQGVVARAAPIDSSSGIGVGPFGPNGAHPGNRAFAEARRDNTLDGIVVYCEAQVDGLSLLNADSYTEPFGPPVLQVASDHRDALTSAVENAATCTLVVDLDTEPTTATNVQARIKGADATLPPLVIMTPKSAWWTCTAERGGGIAIWLGCLRHFAANQPKRDVIFTANTGHELGHVGLDRFIGANEALVGQAHAWLHLGANFATKDSAVRFQASDDALMSLGTEVLGSHGVPPQSTTPVGTRAFGEARNIFDGNGRYISFLGSNRWFHHPDDRWPATVDVERTALLHAAIAQIAQQLASGSDADI